MFNHLAAHKKRRKCDDLERSLSSTQKKLEAQKKNFSKEVVQLKEKLADISSQKRDLEVAIDVVGGANNLKVQAANKLALREME